MGLARTAKTVFGTRARRVALGLTLAASGGFALAFGSGGTAVAQTTPTQPPGLNHFLCYSVTSLSGSGTTQPGFTPPAKVELLNQFSTKEFRPTFGAVDIHCNPAVKVITSSTGTQQSYPLVSPDYHLLCFAIKATQSPNTHLVKVTNQFGTAELRAGAPTQLCLPSLKSLATPPSFAPPAAGEIVPDHFTCYPVAYVGTARFSPPGAVSVGDEFDNLTPTPVQVGSPTSLCLPTQKTVFSATGGTTVTPITNAVAHLLCFSVSPTPFPSTPVWDQNQFGVGGFTVHATKSLCLPSFKTLVK